MQIFKFQEGTSVHFGGQFSGEVDKNINKKDDENKVSFKIYVLTK